ncbi:MAG: hypothetical protein LUH14_09585 [Clostridiaceae bacterium]|nr:hypothetical protein [Clostridiaceae bacterium]
MKTKVLYWIIVSSVSIFFLCTGYNIFFPKKANTISADSTEASLDYDAEDDAGNIEGQEFSYRMGQIEEQALSDASELIENLKKGTLSKKEAISTITESKDFLQNNIAEADPRREIYFNMLYHSAYLQNLWSENNTDNESIIRENLLISAATKAHNYLIDLGMGSLSKDIAFEELFYEVRSNDIDKLVDSLIGK